MKNLKVFTSSSCAPCLGLKRMLKSIKVPYIVTYIDVSEEPLVARIHEIRAVPHMKLYHDVSLVRSHVGAITPDELANFLK